MEKTLAKKQFDVLCAFLGGNNYTQRELCEKTELSLGMVNRIVKDLNDLGYLADGAITEAGMSALEPYRVKRAVFVAAGFGSRLVPVTLNTPKPLVRVKGTRIIDTLIDAVLAAGIEEIYIVRGYLAEQFDQLLYKYPMLHFIENPSYNEANNISSVMYARELLADSYVLEADLLLSNPQLIKPYQYSSNFLGIPVKKTDDWCFTVKGNVIAEQIVGGVECYQEVGISYWSREDGMRLAEDVKTAYEMPGGKELYWDQVPFVKCKGKYKVEIRPCKSEDVTEIDTFRELKKIDSSYDV